MKRCPECNLVFADAEQFCEADGTRLVTVEDATSPLPVDRTSVAPQPKSSRGLLPIGALACFLLGVLLALVYFTMFRQRAQENSNTTSSSSSTRQQEIVPPSRPPPVIASPSPEPSVEPSPSPSVETPTPQISPTRVASSSNPISTAAGGKGNPVVITLNSGLTIDADEAWQTAEGIWYRKNSVVSLLDPKNVKAIEKVPPTTPQPSASPSP